MPSPATSTRSLDSETINLPEIGPDDAEIILKAVKEDKIEIRKKARSGDTATRKDGLEVLRLEVQLLEESTPTSRPRRKRQVEIIDEAGKRMQLCREMYKGVFGTVEKVRKHMRDAKIVPIQEDWDKTINKTIIELDRQVNQERSRVSEVEAERDEARQKCDLLQQELDAWRKQVGQDTSSHLISHLDPLQETPVHMNFGEEASYPTPKWSPVLGRPTSLRNSDIDEDHDDTWDSMTKPGVDACDDHWEYNSASSTSDHIEVKYEVQGRNEDGTPPLEHVEESGVPLPYGVPACNDWRDFSIAGALHYSEAPSSGSSPTPSAFDLSRHISYSVGNTHKQINIHHMSSTSSSSGQTGTFIEADFNLHHGYSSPRSTERWKQQGDKRSHRYHPYAQDGYTGGVIVY